MRFALLELKLALAAIDGVLSLHFGTYFQLWEAKFRFVTTTENGSTMRVVISSKYSILPVCAAMMKMLKPGLGEVFLVCALADGLALKWFPVWTVSTIVCLQLLLAYLYLKHVYGIFQRLGIAFLPPSFILGNFMHLRRKMHERDMEDVIKYGKVYGTFFGQLPELVVADVDILKQILVKDFFNFANHREFEGNEMPPEELISNWIILLKDARWKTLRNTITPAFTTGKMNRMTPLVNNCIENLSAVLMETAEGKTKEFDVHKLFGALTMDVISSCAFATDVNSIRNPDNELVLNSKKIFDNDIGSAFMVLVLLFPFTFFRILPTLGLNAFFMRPYKFFEGFLSKMIKERREKPTDSADFLQLMINAHDDTDVDDSTGDPLAVFTRTGAESKRAPESDYNWGSSKRKLTDIEIMAQSNLFLVAGYHTTAITLTLCAYNLALHPDIQDRCVEELRSALNNQPSNGNKISFEVVRSQLPYLEAVILETLRFYPPATRMDRSCRSDCEINGVKFKKGMTINIPVYAIHHLPEYYPDPETFDPERFLPENRAKRNPLTFLPFGFGPRNCVGMRFALLELKLTLANVLLQFKLNPCTKTEIPPKLTSSGLIKFETSIWLAIEKRS